MSTATTEFEPLDTTEDDPLADLGLDFGTEVATVQAECDNSAGMERIKEFLAAPAREGEPFYLDFETIPDFSRMDSFGFDPLPTMPPVDAPDALMPADQFISQTVPEIKSWLERHNPPREWLDEVVATEKAGKARKGVMDEFSAHDKRISAIVEAEGARIKQMSVTPMMCRICCVAWAVGSEKPRSIYCGDDTLMERHLLDMVWKLLARQKPLVGFGVGFFDTPLMLTRSMILKVDATRYIDNRKYGSSDVLDLHQALYGATGGRGLGLKTTCRSLGIEPQTHETDGSQVYELFKAGKVDEIRAYNESDVDLTQRLHKRMAGYFCV